MADIKGLVDRFFRLLVFVIIAGVIIFLIARHISSIKSFVFALIGFGTVVFVHEFGHFMAAKLSDIRVEAFSIGFGPVLVGVLKTAEGFRVRILPGFGSRIEGADSNESLFEFTIGSKGKAGETEYRIGLIPFGGFVRMLGQEDTKEVEKSDDPRSYANKPVGKRMMVIVAGVVFNGITAILLFGIAFSVGINLPPAVVGGVIPGSPADKAGLKAGDEVIEIDGKRRYLDFMDVTLAAALSDVNEAVNMQVRSADGGEKTVSLVPEYFGNSKLRMFGIVQAMTLKIAALKDEEVEKLFRRTGLRPADRVVAIDGVEVEHNRDIAEAMKDNYGPEAQVLVERRVGNKQSLVTGRIGVEWSYTKTADANSDDDLLSVCSMVPRLRVDAVARKRQMSWRGFFQKIGILKEQEKETLQAGDIIIGIGDVENPTYAEMRQVTEAHENGELTMRLIRDTNGLERIVDVNVVPKREGDRVVIGFLPVFDLKHTVVAKTIEGTGKLKKLDIPGGALIERIDGEEVGSFYDVVNIIRRNEGKRISIDWRVDEMIAGAVAFEVGDIDKSITVKPFMAETIPFESLNRLYKAGNPLQAMVMGFRKTGVFVVQTYLTFKSLLTGLVSPRLLVGPVGIISMSYEIVSKRPIVYYAYFIGLINVCIAVFNVLPILPFDGGHLVFLAIEKIKGSAVSEKAQAAILYPGLIFVIALFLYLTFYDVARLIFGTWF